MVDAMRIRQQQYAAERRTKWVAKNINFLKN